jgi:hypothetical protein
LSLPIVRRLIAKEQHQGRGFESFPLYVYDFVVDLCIKLGALREELVPFERYASEAMSLARPASVARAARESGSLFSLELNDNERVGGTCA